MERDDITVEILKSIRDEIRQTNARIDQTNARIDQTNAGLEQTTTTLSSRIDETNARLDRMRDELGRRIVESEMRTATAITDLAGNVQQLVDVLRSERDLRPRVERCEQEIAEIKRRLVS